MKRNHYAKWFVLILLFAEVFVSSAAITLNIGDQAPKIQVSKWVQGEAVTDFKTNNTYLLEFWATWSGPCRDSVPRLNEIHKKFKDKGLIVIGVNTWERDTAKIEPFIKELGSNMTYRVAVDLIPENEKACDGKMAETWMATSGEDTIPTAYFVNKEGKIAWIGHSIELEEKTITQLVDGTFDVKRASEERRKVQSAEQELLTLVGDLDAYMGSNDWNKASVTVDEIEKRLKPNEKANLAFIRLEIAIGRGDSKIANKLAMELGNQNKESALIQNNLAWRMATDDHLKERDLEGAAKLAHRANDLSGGKSSVILNTFARIKFMQGEKDKAIELESKAVELSTERVKAGYQKALESYKTGKLPPVE